MGGRGDKMVGAIGFEPTTSWSQTRRSTRLSYTPTTDPHGRGLCPPCQRRRAKSSARGTKASLSGLRPSTRTAKEMRSPFPSECE